MIRQLLSLCLIAVLSISSPAHAKDDAIKIITPVHGYFVFMRGSQEQQLVILDTFTGATRVLDKTNFGIDLLTWNGQDTTYFKANGLYLLNVFADEEPKQLTSDPNWYFVPYRQGTIDNNQFLGISLSLTDKRKNIEIWNIHTGEHTTILSFTTGEPAYEDEKLAFQDIVRLDWNPIYPEWIAFELSLSQNPLFNDSNSVSDYFSNKTNPDFIFNRSTGELISVSELFKSRVDMQKNIWSPDGKELYVNLWQESDPTSQGQILALQNVNNNWTLTPQKNFVYTPDIPTVQDWFGVDDLLIASKNAQPSEANTDQIFSIAEIVNNNLESLEFFQIPDGTLLSSPYPWGWYPALTPEEKLSFSCMFDKSKPECN